MTLQGALLRILSNGWLGDAGRRYMRRRTWTVVRGRAAGFKIHYPQNTSYIGGLNEIHVQDAMANHLKPGNVFYDVGGNMGFFSLVASRYVGAAGKIVAFEPLAENAATIKENFRLNHLDAAAVCEVAVGRVSGSAELLLTEWDGGSTLSSSAVSTSDPVARRTVRAVALDDFIPAEKLPLPNFVKIDVEGVELDVIQGMTRTIAEARPILLYEVDDGDEKAFHRRWDELDAVVKALGYEIIRLADSYPTIDWQVGHSLALPRT